MALNVINPYQIFHDSTGAVRTNGWVSFFVNTTSTLGSIYSDEALTVTQTNPYNLDAYGRIIGDVKFSGLMTLQESNSDGSDVITTDNVTTTDESGLLRTDLASTTATKGASLVSFESGETVQDLASTATDDGTKGFNLVSIPLLTGETGIENHAFARGNVLRFIPISLHNGIRDRTNVTDLSAYIQNTFDSAKAGTDKKISAPSGTYVCTTSISLAQTAGGQIDGLTVEGDGKYATIFDFTGVSGFSFDGSSSTIFGMKFSGFTILGDADTTTVTLKSSTITYGSGGTAAADGMALKSVQLSRFSDIRIQAFGGQGLYLWRGTASNIFENMYFRQNATLGVLVNEDPATASAVCDHNLFTRCDSNENGAGGFLINNSNNQIFSECKAVGNGLGTAFTGTTKRGAWMFYGSLKSTVRDGYPEASGDQHIYFGDSIAGSAVINECLGNVVKDSYFVGTASLRDADNNISVFVDENSNNTAIVDNFNGATIYDLGIATKFVEGYHTAAANYAMLGTTPKNWEFRQLNSLATVGQWAQGMRMYKQNPSSGTAFGWVCTVGGTFTTISTTGAITSGTDSLVVAATTNMNLGDFITIAGVTGVKQITWIAGTTVTIDSNADATVSGAAVANSSPTMTVF